MSEHEEFDRNKDAWQYRYDLKWYDKIMTQKYVYPEII